VICDRCAEHESEFANDQSWKLLKFYCAGSDSRGRAPIAELFSRPAWKHDMSKHSEEERRRSRQDPF
jgi:hypothetical protein